MALLHSDNSRGSRGCWLLQASIMQDISDAKQARAIRTDQSKKNTKHLPNIPQEPASHTQNIICRTEMRTFLFWMVYLGCVCVCQVLVVFVSLIYPTDVYCSIKTLRRRQHLSYFADDSCYRFSSWKLVCFNYISDEMCSQGSIRRPLTLAGRRRSAKIKENTPSRNPPPDASEWSPDWHHPTSGCFPFIPYFFWFFEEEEVKFLGQHFYYVIHVNLLISCNCVNLCVYAIILCYIPWNR